MDQEPRLNTWKEIAEYLGVSLRTAENYEQQKGLPVHRMGSDRSRVWAYRAELDAWKSQKAGQAAAPESRRGILVWRGLLAAFLIWELISYRSSPREDFPTFSSVTDTIMSTHPGRFALFAIWLAIGYGIFRR